MRKILPFIAVGLFIFVLALLIRGFYKQSDGLTPAADSDVTTQAVIPNRMTSSPDIEILDRGQEPRSLIELDLESGREVNASMGLGLSIKIKVDKSPDRAARIPHIDLPVKLKVDRLVGDDSADVIMSFGQASMGSEQGATSGREELAKRLEIFNGISCRFRLQKNGSAKEMKCKSDANSAEAQQAISQMEGSLSTSYVPLPSEPVGIGAKWRVKKDNVSFGAMMGDSVADYILTKKDGGAYWLQVATSVDYKEQPLREMQSKMPKGFSAKLSSGRSTSTGDVKIDPNSPLTQVHLTSDSKQEISIDGTQDGSPVSQSLFTEISVQFSIEAR